MGSSRSVVPLAALVVATQLAACADLLPDGIALSKKQSVLEHRLRLGQRVPDTAESAVTGALVGRVASGTPAFTHLVRYVDPDIVFKDEERTGADRMMTPGLRLKLRRLAPLISREWPALRLRVTEAWDEKHEHGGNSIHYEGRAADVTTSDLDPGKLGRLARLAVDAGLDWVFYEDTSHVHVSVAR